MKRSRWPDFFVIGAGKSGTTTLFHLLQHHPQIFLPAEKEPHYFSDPEYCGNPPAMSEETYLSLYRDAGKDQQCGDFSTSYFICPQTPVRIRSRNKAARIIVILRDPVERAFSDYLMLSRRDQLIRDDFLTEVSRELDRLRAGKLEWPFLVRTGLYGQNIQRWLQHFGRDRFLFLSLDELTDSPLSVHGRICAFLHVDPQPISRRKVRQRHNVFSEMRSPLLTSVLSGNPVTQTLARIAPRQLNEPLKSLRQRILLRQAERPVMPHAAWSLLQPVFDEELDHLQELIGFDVAPLKKRWPRKEPSQLNLAPFESR